MLRPGGRYAIHELGLMPDGLDPQIATEIRKALARSIKVNARPLTAAEWRTLFEDAGFDVQRARVFHRHRRSLTAITRRGRRRGGGAVR